MSVPSESHSPDRTTAAPVPSRLDALDLLRGLVVVLMALDHVRDFFSSVRANPSDLAHTTAALFATRWVTHFCAPAFSFLAGTGAYLSLSRGGKTRSDVARFLVTRGLWLIALELTVVRFAWTFNFAYAAFTPLIVIWALGCSMIALAPMVFLPVPAVMAIGLLFVAGHNALDGVHLQTWWWAILHEPRAIPFLGARLWTGYPILPWIGVMALGWSFGPIVNLPPERRRRVTLLLGVGSVALFLALRAINHYGDPKPWVPQPSALFTALSFINCTKYPPSLLYLLMTLGPSLCLLALWDGVRLRPNHPLLVFGRVPLFFYLVHLYVIHAAAVITFWPRFGREVLMVSFRRAPAGYGVGLLGVYLAWALVIAALYPVCRWYAGVKRQSTSWWLSYL